MDKRIEEARTFLEIIGMPKAQQSDLCCYVILAMARIKPDTPWSQTTNEWIGIHDIIQFINKFYKINYAENSRETVRKQALHRFRTAALVEDNGKATNSPNYKYRLTKETVKLLKNFQTPVWESTLKRFLHVHEKLVDIYASKKKMTMMPVNIDGKDFKFSAGKHNQLQKDIIEEFAPRFAPSSLHDKMPDVVLYREDKDWIYFVESVTSVGPMDPKRILEITEMTKDVTAGKIFVTAFLDFKTYKKFAEELAWETEVWIAEMPEHMIHLNGDRFMGPRG